MKKGQDILVKHPNLFIIHQKVPGRELGKHSHKEHEIFIPLQGEIIVTCMDKSASAGPGKLLYVPPNLEHSFSSSAHGEGERVILLISDKAWRKSTSNTYLPTSLPLNSLVRELTFYLLINPKTKYAKTFISALTESLIDQLDVYKNSKFDGLLHLEAKIKDERIKKAYQLILDNTNISVSELAKSSGLSSRNLNRLFTGEVGYSPKQFIIGLKIENAKNLILNSDKTITEIGFEVGYNSLPKFISAFQKYTGQLPSEFRKKFE